MFLAIASIPLLLVSALTFTNYKKSLEANRFSQLQDLAVFRADSIEAYFTGLKGHIEVSQGFYNIKKNLPVLTRLADDPSNQEFIDAKKMLDAQLQQMRSVSDLSDIMLVNPQGRVVYANRPGHFLKDMSNGIDAEKKAFAEGKSGIHFSDVYFDKAEDNRFEMLLTAPATDFNGDFIGVIAFEIDMTPVYKLLQDTTGLGNTGEVLIGKRTGNQVEYLNPLRHDPNAALKRKIDIGSEIGRPMQEAVQGRTGSGLATDYRGKKVIAAWRYIPSLDWGLVAKIDTREAFADVTNLRNLAIALLFIIIVLSSITAFSIAHSISEPIKRLSEGAAIIGSGNLDYKIGNNQKDEIGQLSRSFDKMTLDLKQTTASRDELNREIDERKQAQEALRLEQERLDLALKSASMGVWRWEINEDKRYFDDQTCHLLGIDAKTFTGAAEEFFRAVNPEYRDKLKISLARTIEQNAPYESEYMVTWPDGSVHYLTARGRLTRDKDGRRLRINGIIWDMTEHRRAEDALRQSEERYRTLFETMLEGFCIIEVVFDAEKKPVDYCFLDINPAFERQTGLHNAKGKLMRELAPAHEKHWFEIYGKVAMTGEPARFENEARALNRWFDVSAVRVGGPESRKVAILFSDISKRKYAEEALKKSHDELEIRVKERTADLDEAVSDLQEQVESRIKAEETVKAERKRFENVLEMMPAYAILLTPDYHVAYANRTFRDWFGDDNGKKCYEFLFNRTEPCENCETYNVLKTGKSQFWEWTGPNGHNYDIYDYPFTDTDGLPMIMEIGVDVTAHKQAQAALRSVSLYARGLLEASLDPLVTISHEGKITDVNMATEAVTGISRERLIGSDFSNYFTEPQKANEGYKKVIAEGKVIDYPLTIRHTSGHTTDVLYNATVYKNEAGQIQGVFAAARDITEKKAAEAELEKYRLHLEDLVKNRTEELVRSNKDLEQFAYVASHDLQEPLRAISGFIELLRRSLEKHLDEKTNEYMNFSIDGAKRMQSLINGLLEYSRVGTQGKKPQEVNSKEALDEALAHLQAGIEESGAKITADDLPVVYFDDLQLMRLFQNLIGNAIKFRSDEIPQIHVSAIHQNAAWRFAVRDNGIGIEPQYAERIFMIFQRLHTRKTYAGTGIGLSICKKIIERHGGKIWVKSTPESGSTFYFTVPDTGESSQYGKSET